MTIEHISRNHYLLCRSKGVWPNDVQPTDVWPNDAVPKVLPNVGVQGECGFTNLFKKVLTKILKKEYNNYFERIFYSIFLENIQEC